MLTPDRAGETVKVLGEEKRTQYGKLLGYQVAKEIPHCIVSPAGDSLVNGTGFMHGDISKVQVLAPSGTTVAEGQRIDIRGELYTVDFAPFDYTVGRRPAHPFHRPKVLFTASRGDVHDHIG
ncbi:hypothetical protein [Corynebacterium aurimucosum]|uniref:hypothetical protein n=1 Tax=Corynebacterium aurimucosum TaxID=169292 RepID=UPI00187AAEA0|nr:hypothetical protein [Corynebacterium aurimucosum]MBE7338122.1 hypothetical protein [Corynebacterium aurimucosum]